MHRAVYTYLRPVSATLLDAARMCLEVHDSLLGTAHLLLCVRHHNLAPLHSAGVSWHQSLAAVVRLSSHLKSWTLSLRW